jgi:hypothetical protein
MLPFALPGPSGLKKLSISRSSNTFNTAVLDKHPLTKFSLSCLARKHATSEFPAKSLGAVRSEPIEGEVNISLYERFQGVTAEDSPDGVSAGMDWGVTESGGKRGKMEAVVGVFERGFGDVSVMMSPMDSSLLSTMGANSGICGEVEHLGGIICFLGVVVGMEGPTAESSDVHDEAFISLRLLFHRT